MKRSIILLVFSFIVLLSVNAQEENKALEYQQRYFDINKNIDIYSSILRELDMFYVDSLDINKTVKTGIDNMLKSLDPYTEYFNTEKVKDFTFITTGEYAGIGASIRYNDSLVVITDPFEGKPAAKAGLKAGDVILEIDGKDMSKTESKEGQLYGNTLSDYVSSNLKGQPGTVVSVTVKRPGEKKPITIKVTREKIVMDPINYYGMVSPTTGYINLSTFTDKSSADTKKAFLDMKKQGMTSLIFDLRMNTGGILEEAVQIVNMFIPKGKTVVSTKGRLKQSDRTYLTTVEPIDTEIPIILLIDKNSASASEIVAGALQDMDRAVLVGQRTFGKGLVQATRELPYGEGIKMTTAKYYIPSGRCVQEIDYSHRNADGSASTIPDSLTHVFTTEAGRKVKDGGGVTPDVKLEEEKIVTISYYLENQSIIFDWVTDWVLNHKKIESPEVFTISDKDYDDFKNYVKTKDFKYDRMSEKSIESLKEVMEFEGYMKTAGDEFKALEAKLVPDLDRDLETFKEDIINHINSEIVKRYYYQKGEYIIALKKDLGLKKALEILNDQDLYKNILSVNSDKNAEVGQDVK